MKIWLTADVNLQHDCAETVGTEFEQKERVQMKKRLLAVLLTAALCTLFVAGCGNSKAKTPEEDKPAGDAAADPSAGIEEDNGQVTLRVWSDTAEFDVLNQMFESFKQEYAGQATFDIQLEEHADAETRDNVLGDVHNAGDVFPMADDQLSSMVAGGAVSAVPNGDEIKAQNLEGAAEAACVDGVLYAYPFSADNGYFLYYDKKYFSDSDVQTWDQVLKVAEKNGKQVSMDWGSGWYTYAFWGNTGLEFGINDDGVTNHCNWNTKEGDIKGIDVAKAMLATAESPAFLNAGGDTFLEEMKAGNVIAGVSGVWDAAAVQEAWGNDYGAVKLPTYTVAGKQVQMSSFTGYKMYGVNPYSEHLAWAHKLAEWLSNEENQLLRLEQRFQGPSNIKASESEEVLKIPAIRAVQDQSEYGVLQRVGNNYWDPTTNFGTEVAKGNLSDAQLQKLLDTMVEGITASVAN